MFLLYLSTRTFIKYQYSIYRSLQVKWIMERASAQLRTESEHVHYGQDGEDCKCQECGKEFETPLLAQISSNGFVQQTYYACPRCLTKVPEARKQRSERNEPPTAFKELRPGTKPAENASCQHFFGYLKQRPKDTAIPEDCLVCDKMIECMVR